LKVDAQLPFGDSGKRTPQCKAMFLNAGGHLWTQPLPLSRCSSWLW
jgi:hypothetical protein